MTDFRRTGLASTREALVVETLVQLADTLIQDYDVIEYLVSKGARLDVKDREGRTPVRWAEGVFLAAVGAERRPATVALLEKLGAK